MNQLESMAWYLAVIDAGSLSGAAVHLGRPLSTVSRRITELETHLGVRLLLRSTRRLDVTEAGRSYAVSSRRILADLAEAERAAKGEHTAPRGRLTITAPVLFGRLHVLPVIVAFLERYPDIDVQLVSADRIVHLVDDEIDLAVRIGQLPDSRLVATKLGEVRRVVCGSPAHLAEHGAPASPTDLVARDCIHFEALGGTATWPFSVDGAERQHAVRSRLIVNGVETAVDAAVHGLGLTQVLSYQIAGKVRSRELGTVLDAFEVAPLPVHLVFESGRAAPAKLRAFLDFAAPRLRAALGTRAE